MNFGNKKIILLIVGAILILCLVFGFLYINRNSKKTSEYKNISTTTQGSMPSTVDKSSVIGKGIAMPPYLLSKASSTVQDIKDNPGMFVATLYDQDNDGLPDVVEAKLGTDPKKADSDNDNLSDYQEVMIYSTDPLNPDTDGDGYNDGDEIKNGFNACGVGKLPTRVMLVAQCAKYKKK